ncbi:hypothetical protein J6590_039292 [Homalodisca vitripennis]|nr:hypothetical protein J6590_039292 [Homalodisca vitripennis]
MDRLSRRRRRGSYDRGTHRPPAATPTHDVYCGLQQYLLYHVPELGGGLPGALLPPKRNSGTPGGTPPSQEKLV